MADASDADVCAICLGGMVRGQAGFTAECSHVFHLNCISASVAHGNHDCPLCKAPWTVLPAVNAPRVPPPPSPQHVPPPSSSSRQVRGRTYEDDDPVQEIVQADAEAGTNGGAMVLKAHCECPAVARGSSRDNFAVLVHVKAPSAAATEAARAPLDLVTVLDVSGSMIGSKLALLKQAMGFVIDNLGSADRLSVVTFNHDARRLFRLVRTSDAGKAEAKRAVESLFANGGTDIGKGLRVAAKVLDHRRYKNAVTSIMLLSDGQDSNTYAGMRHGRNAANYITLVPSSLTYSGAGNRPPAVHTFGFGADHDAAAMHTIAEMTAGTFSFIENEAVLQDSFAQCLGGLLTVAVQEARIVMTCLHPGVRVREVKSGRYDNRVDAGGRAASVDVGELYADEERRFLVLLDVPAAGADDGVTGLIKLSCNYRDAATGQVVDVTGDDAVVQRPVEVTDEEPSLEVERERLRVAATEDMAAARDAADRNEHAEGAGILRRRLEAVERSVVRMSGGSTFTALEGELRDLIARVEDRDEYETVGRACFLSGMSSHRQQRAGGMQLMSQSVPLSLELDNSDSDEDDDDECEEAEEEEEEEGLRDCLRSRTMECKRPIKQSKRSARAYATPAMAAMVKRSRDQRRKTAAAPPQQQQQKRHVEGQQQQPGDQSEPRKRHRKH
ncbi:hypothetical protein ACQ4PT_010583 [Festuca glaucescens]